MNDRKFSEQYAGPVNRAINFISENLSRPVSLEEIAEEACLSPFHFHRIFKEVTGETAGQFLTRLRMEKAAYQLLFMPERPVTEIALDAGYSTSQNFTRAFRQYYGQSPSDYRLEKNSNTGTMVSKIGKAQFQSPLYNHDSLTGMGNRGESGKRLQPGGIKKAELPGYRVAYLRKVGPYTEVSICPLFTRLVLWARVRGLAGPQTLFFGVVWDSEAVTPVEKCRFDACVVIPEHYQAGNEVQTQVLRSGPFALYRCQVTDSDPQHSFRWHWEHLLADLMPAAGLRARMGPHYEIFHNLLQEESRESLDVELCAALEE